MPAETFIEINDLSKPWSKLWLSGSGLIEKGWICDRERIQQNLHAHNVNQ